MIVGIVVTRCPTRGYVDNYFLSFLIFLADCSLPPDNQGVPPIGSSELSRCRIRVYDDFGRTGKSLASRRGGWLPIGLTLPPRGKGMRGGVAA